MVSAIRRLLDEISWEGDAAKYRAGGLGLENVLTVEVFQALDFLPRRSFLGAILRSSDGAGEARGKLASEVSELQVDVLPGDLKHSHLPIRVQPDVLLTSAEALVCVEAKRIRRSSFQPEQLARELLVTADAANGRTPLLLLVLGAAPPLSIRGHGHLGIAAAVELGAKMIAHRTGQQVTLPDPATTIAFVTWAEIATLVRTGAEQLAPSHDPMTETVQRVASVLLDAVQVHS